jgi:dUTP pyrophosphatase
MNLKIKKLDQAALLPTYATPGAACFDLYSLPTSASEEKEGSWMLEEPGAPRWIPTGLAFEVAEGHVMMIFPRKVSGFTNCVGVISSKDLGHVWVKLPRDQLDPSFKPGDCVAQGMVIPVQQVAFTEVSKVSAAERRQLWKDWAGK